MSNIEVFDKYGRPFHITRDEYRSTVLPVSLRSNWDKPDLLYAGIVQAMGEDFIEEAAEAVEHLHEMEAGSARSITSLAYLRLRQKRVDEAHDLLEGYLASHGPEASVLNNLARVYVERNDDDKVEPTLWRSLEADPNFENSVAWYEALHRERGGVPASIEALRRVAALPGAWRARVHLARHALDARDLRGALELQREALEIMGDEVPAEALMTMTGDLGKRGFLAQLIELGAAHFVPERHGILVGNNLVKAYFDSGRIDEARAVVERLFKLNRPDYRPSLRYWEAQFLKSDSAREMKVGPTIEMTMYVVDGPVWSHPASPANSIFPRPPEGAPRVAFVGGTAAVANAPATPQVQLADLAGRLSRIVPLYLSEQAQFFAGARARSLFPWMHNSAGGSFVLMTEATRDTDAISRARGGGGCDFVVITHVKALQEPWSATMRLVRCSDGKCVFEKEAFATTDRTDIIAVELAIELRRALAAHAGAKPGSLPAYLPPAPPQLASYLLRLEQLLAVRCATSAHALHGIRDIVDGCLHLCLDLPQSVLLRTLLADVVARVRNLRPDVIGEYAERLALLEREHPVAEPAQSTLHPMLAGA